MKNKNLGKTSFKVVVNFLEHCCNKPVRQMTYVYIILSHISFEALQCKFTSMCSCLLIVVIKENKKTSDRSSRIAHSIKPYRDPVHL